MFKVSVHITIGKLEIPFVVDGWVKSSWKYQTDTAQIVLPRKITVIENEQKKPIYDVIKRGDKVTIKLGYDNKVETEFKGYVSAVKTGTPLVIDCEDEMWQLKQSKKINASWKDATLEDVIKKIAPNVKYELHDPNMKLGAFRIDDVNSSAALTALKSYGLKTYFKDEVLHVGFAYGFEYNKVKYNFQKNVIERGNNLKYENSDDVRIKVTGVSILPTNEKIEVEYGDEDGALRTLHYYNLSKNELEKIIAQDFDLLKYDGFRGSFTGFHLPVVRHGDVAEIESNQYIEHNGSYFVDDVTTVFGYDKGIKRNITLGKKAS
jgi:hypothetical protein